MIKIAFIIPFAILMVSSCQNSLPELEEEYEKTRCDEINEDSLVVLEGTLNINSKDIIVFENVDKRNEWQRKIHLVPCSNNLKDYIFETYDSFLYLKNFDEKFWVKVEGNFLTADTLEYPQQFLFQFVALIDEIEALVDTSQALGELTGEHIESINTKNE